MTFSDWFIILSIPLSVYLFIDMLISISESIYLRDIRRINKELEERITRVTDGN